jgi:hypothetical protein
VKGKKFVDSSSKEESTPARLLFHLLVFQLSLMCPITDRVNARIDSPIAQSVKNRKYSD